MAGHASFTVVLDACVLYPIVLANAMMSLAAEDLFAPKWSTIIEDEWIRSVLARQPSVPEEGLRNRFLKMRQAVPDWQVETEAIQALIPSFTLPDPNDRHVLAAAVAGHADAIVTMNLKDFPDAVLEPLGLIAIHPDEFIVNQLDLDGYRALGALKAMRERLKNPPKSVDEFIASFRRNHLVMSADRLQAAADAGLV